MSSPSSPMRRSTRGAALVATTRIAEALAPQRRSTRLAFLSDNFTGNGGVATRGGTMALDAATAGGGGADSSLLAVGGGDVNRPPRGGGGTKDKPIVLDDDGSIDELEPKPAAAAAAGVAAAIAHVAAVAAAAEEPPGDFTCAICLDAPPCMSEVASISGCTHRFCFDCIDRWAETENRCPCCKARFRTIDRVVALPPGPAETEEGGEGGGRRGKRKRERRDSSPNTRGSRRGGSASTDRRVNSRVVEERNQQSVSAFLVDAAMMQQIMSIFLNPRVEGALLGSGQITYGTSEDGRPQIRMIHPRSGIMMGIMEVHFSDASSPDGLAGEGGVARSAGINAGGARMRISRAHRRPPFSSSGSESDASWASAGVPPPETRLMERRSTVNLANGSALRSAAADSSASGIPPSSVAGGIAGGNPATAIAAAQQARSSFASFFSSLMDGAGRSATSPPGGGASARSRTAEGTIAEASPARGASSPLNRMTIRVVTRPAASNGGTLSSVSRDDRSLSTNRLPSRSSSGRSASGGSDDEGSGRGGSDEPIVVE